LQPAATGSATRPPGPSRIQVTPRCWLTWSEPTATIIGWSPATPRGSRPSGCWPGLISRPSGAANASSTARGRPSGASTRRRWKPSDGPGLRRCGGSVADRAHPGVGPPAFPGQDRCGTGPRRPPAQPPRPGGPDPGRVGLRPAGRAPTDQPRLRTVVQATIAVVASLNQQIATLEEALGEGVQHAPGRQDHPLPARTGDGPGRPGAGRVRR
jgi:hypothetical protein